MGLRRSPISENAETALTSWTADSNVTAVRGGLSRGKWTNSEQVEICKPSIPLLEITIWLNHEQKIGRTCLKSKCVKFRLSCCSHWWPPSLRARQVALEEGWWPLSAPPDHLSLCFPSHLRILKLHQKFGIHLIRKIGFNEFLRFKYWSGQEWRYLMGGQKVFQELHPIWRLLVCGWHYRQLHLGVQPKCPCRQFLQPISAHYWRPFKWSDQRQF